MNVRITRPVVIPTATGFRHLPPGLVLSLPDADAVRVLQQQAGIQLSTPHKSRQKTVEPPAEAANAPA